MFSGFGSGEIPPRPGSAGEHQLQREWGTTERADRFYADQVLDHLNARMREFTASQEWFFLATADSRGECDSSFRAGPSGILHVLDEKTLCYPEYRGNGVLASLGNIRENPHIGILMVDFTHDRIGLHVNGRARLVPDGEMRERHRGLPVDDARGRRPVVWVEAEVTEAYIHCSKHIPRLVKAPLLQRRRAWGSDNSRRKGGDYFGVKAARPSALRWFRTPAGGGSGGGPGNRPGGGTREVAADGVPGGPVGGPEGTGVRPLN